MSNLCESCTHPAKNHDGDRGQCTDQVTDFYGTWACICPAFEKDGDQ